MTEPDDEAIAAYCEIRYADHGPAVNPDGSRSIFGEAAANVLADSIAALRAAGWTVEP